MPIDGKNSQDMPDPAEQAKRAADLGFEGKSGMRETPRQVYLDGCLEIANALREDGFTYLKSGPKLRRKSDDFRFEISFQSSHANIPGELVVLWIHGYIFSPSLKKWRSDHACLVKRSDFVAGGQIGNLRYPQAWLAWNLALPGERGRQTADALSAIRAIICPSFAMFDDIPSLVQRLVDEDLPAFSPASTLDFLMCFGTKADALQAAVSMFQRMPTVQAGYAEACARFRQQGLPSYTPSVHAEVLAMASLVYDFPDLGREAG